MCLCVRALLSSVCNLHVCFHHIFFWFASTFFLSSLLICTRAPSIPCSLFSPCHCECVLGACFNVWLGTPIPAIDVFASSTAKALALDKHVFHHTECHFMRFRCSYCIPFDKLAHEHNFELKNFVCESMYGQVVKRWSSVRFNAKSKKRKIHRRETNTFRKSSNESKNWRGNKS